jgi:hypothetical protein
MRADRYAIASSSLATRMNCQNDGFWRLQVWPILLWYPGQCINDAIIAWWICLC